MKCAAEQFNMEVMGLELDFDNRHIDYEEYCKLMELLDRKYHTPKETGRPS